MELQEIVDQFAAAMTLADNRAPVAISPRSGRIYRPGIGRHPEDRAVDLVVDELRVSCPDWKVSLRVCYPNSKQTCDFLIGEPTDWAIEIKMFRPNGDNGKPDDTAIKDILSPFSADRSALTDCKKLASSTIAPRRAILFYGFEDSRHPLRVIVDAFELLARARVQLGQRCEAKLGKLVHPVHASGAVFGWEVSP